MGMGEPGASNTFYRWVDACPIPGLAFAGLSSWDKHLAYRSVTVGPPLKFESAPTPAESAVSR